VDNLSAYWILKGATIGTAQEIGALPPVSALVFFNDGRGNMQCIKATPATVPVPVPTAAPNTLFQPVYYLLAFTNIPAHCGSTVTPIIRLGKICGGGGDVPTLLYRNIEGTGVFAEYDGESCESEFCEDPFPFV